MTDTAPKPNLLARLRLYALALGALWSLCAGASLAWNLHEQEDRVLKLAGNSAQVTFENDILYRKWAAQQGGVYVPVTDRMQPNPYLHAPNRDVQTTGGLALTLINPAFMARQVNQMGRDIRSSKGHITSLRPIRPENKPDAWEASALNSFETGAKEVSSVERMADGEYVRFMRPFFVDASCLKCHASQGYKVGDIRGGISVSVPLTGLRQLEWRATANMTLAHAALWALGIGGLLIAMNGLGKQVRAREIADAALEKTVDELKRSNRELEQFAYVASHDLQEPLRQVRAYVGLIRERHGDKLDGKAGQYFEFVDQGAERMSGLVSGLLAYSRVGAPGTQREAVPSQQAVDAALGNLQAAIAESQAQVTCDELPTVMAEPTQLTQLFQNLIGNAIKFRREGVPPDIRVGGCPEGPIWLFWIKDNGIGIDPQYYEKIFLIFQRLHGRGQYAGTGIGLAICKKIVEQHGGRIWVESEPGGGSTFYFTLARDDSE